LLIAAKGDDSRPREGFTYVTHSARPARPGIFFIKDNLLLYTRPATTVFPGPAHAGPAALIQSTFPGYSLLDIHVLITGATATANLFELAAQIIRQPVGYLAAKYLVFC